MITLDVNLSYLIKNYGVNTKRINQAGLTTIDEFMEAEAVQGNKEAANYEYSVFNDPEQILKLFQLTSPKNRFLILRNLKAEDLQFLMQFLDDGVIHDALKYINQDKLMSMVGSLPKEKLATVVFNTFSVDKFLKLTQEKEINKFFQSPKMDKNDILKSIDTLEPERLQGMMELLTGQPCQHCDSREVKEKMVGLDDRKFAATLLAFEPQTKKEMIKGMVKEDPDYLLEFSQTALMEPLTKLQKPDFLKSLQVLETEDCLKMLQELPEDIKPAVVTQIDPEVFAQLLSNNFQDILKQISL